MLLYSAVPTSSIITVQDEARLRPLFQLWDKAGDGHISFAELCQGLGKMRQPLKHKKVSVGVLVWACVLTVCMWVGGCRAVEVGVRGGACVILHTHTQPADTHNTVFSPLSSPLLFVTPAHHSSTHPPHRHHHCHQSHRTSLPSSVRQAVCWPLMMLTGTGSSTCRSFQASWWVCTTNACHSLASCVVLETLRYRFLACGRQLGVTGSTKTLKHTKVG